MEEDKKEIIKLLEALEIKKEELIKIGEIVDKKKMN